jgi:hypothetical protein
MQIARLRRTCCRIRRARYSCIGAWCSMSRQALIFRRRQTQHSGSSEPSAVSDPQTKHLTGGFFARSVEMDWHASSNNSAGITGSDFAVVLRRMDTSADPTIAETAGMDKPNRGSKY